MDQIFSAALCLTLASVCISNLRLTTSGPIITDQGGSFFLFECSFVLLFLVFIFKLISGIPRLDHLQKTSLRFLFLFYFSIFFIFLIRDPDIKQFFGGGQLRIQLELWLFGSALIVYPLKEKTMRVGLYIIVFMALLNSFYSIAIVNNIVPPIYAAADRGGEATRYAGLLKNPASIGVLCSISICWALWIAPNWLLGVLISVICGFGIIIADSRTGMLVTLLAFGLRTRSLQKISGTARMSLISFLLILTILILYSTPDAIWYANMVRIVSVGEAVRIWSDNPFGIAWGTFNQFKSNFLIVSPHNLPAISLLYGGIVSFGVVVVAHIFCVRTYLAKSILSGKRESLFQCLLSIVIIIIAASWFEQIFQTVSAMFPFMFAFASLVHMIGQQKYQRKAPSNSRRRLKRRNSVVC